MAGKNGIRESMVKGLSIERRETERPPCPDCGASDPHSRGSAWVCKKCGRGYAKIVRGHVRKNLLDRPEQCPYCSTPHSIWGNGNKWQCSACGKSWVKCRHSKWTDKGERPVCPSCNTPNPASQGLRWLCKCGRSWRKAEAKHKKPKTDMGARPVCPYCATPEPISAGSRWICWKCHKSWTKVYLNLPQPIFSSMELATAKIINV